MERKNFEIVKVQITLSEIKIEYKETMEVEGVEVETRHKYEAVNDAHADFVNAVDNLADVMRQEIGEKIVCSGVAVSGRGDSRGVVLSGVIGVMDNGVRFTTKKLNFNVTSGMEIAANEVEQQAYEYLFSGKREVWATL